MDHPAVEIQLPFDGEAHRLAVLPETTQFFWGAVGIGTTTCSPSEFADKHGLRSRLIETVRDRLDWVFTVDGDTSPLLHTIRHPDGPAELAVWRALDPERLPTTVSVSLWTEGTSPTIAGDRVGLWTPAGDVVQWGETVRTDLTLVPTRDELAMRTDGLWDEHDVYVPNSRPSDR